METRRKDKPVLLVVSITLLIFLTLRFITFFFNTRKVVNWVIGSSGTTVYSIKTDDGTYELGTLNNGEYSGYTNTTDGKIKSDYSIKCDGNCEYTLNENILIAYEDNKMYYLDTLNGKKYYTLKYSDSLELKPFNLKIKLFKNERIEDLVDTEGYVIETPSGSKVLRTSDVKFDFYFSDFNYKSNIYFLTFNKSALNKNYIAIYDYNNKKTSVYDLKKGNVVLSEDGEYYFGLDAFNNYYLAELSNKDTKQYSVKLYNSNFEYLKSEDRTLA